MTHSFLYVCCILIKSGDKATYAWCTAKLQEKLKQRALLHPY